MRKKNNYFIILICVVFVNISQLFSQGFMQWQECESLEAPPNIPVVATANNKLYVLSGTQTANAPTFEYNPSTNEWTTKAPIPQGCYWASAVTVNNKIYVMGGGHPYPGKTYNFIYDPISDTWSSGAPLLIGRMYHSATVVEDKIYIFGGQNGDQTSEWYFDEYNTTTDTWSRKPNLLHSSAWYSGAVTLGNDVYRIAGGGSNPSLTKNFVEKYDSETNSWQQLNNFRIILHAPAAVNANNQILVMGGSSNNKYIDTVWNYNEMDDEWEVGNYPNMPTPRSYHKAVMLNNTLYLYGGMNDMEDYKGNLWKLQIPVSVEETKKLEFNLYPNPVKDILYIEFSDNSEVLIEFHNLLGTKIKEYSARIENSKVTIDMSNFISGIYILNLKSGKKIKQSMIVKY